MADHTTIIPWKKWPKVLQRLGGLFNHLNLDLTFILSHSRSTTPTLEYFQTRIPQLTALDLACYKYLFPPGDIFFDYVDREELGNGDDDKDAVKYNKQHGFDMHQPETIDQVYEQLHNKVTQSNQILLFVFEDMKIDNIGALTNQRRRKLRSENNDELSSTFFNHDDLNTQKLTQLQLVKTIQTRKTKFDLCVTKFLEKVGVNTDESFIEDKLLDEAKQLIPHKPELEDPVELLNKKQKLENKYWESQEILTSDQMVDILKRSLIYKDQIKFEDTFTEAKSADCKSFDVDFYDIHPALVHGIKQCKNIDIEIQLYSHQTLALESLLGNRNNHVIICTSTSSGKSLIYQIPILNDILWDSEDIKNSNTRKSTAIFIFPTKALAQDQKKHLVDLINHIPAPNGRRIIVETYDGDTDPKAKPHIRNYADIVFTNPDALHASILPNFLGITYLDGINGWEKFLRALKFVVLDEIHVYKGTFGINVSYVMARLLRIVNSLTHTDQIQFISCSATVLNPASHFKTICAISSSENIVQIDKDGSACCDKRLLIWQPPPLMNKRGEVLAGSSELASTTSNSVMVPRVSIILELARILLLLLKESKSLKVIVFCPIRKVCEMLMKEVRSLLSQQEFSFGLAEGEIMAYRGGYSKQDRRNIEQKMFNGDVRALVATNALELGVDLSDLDVVITCGFPILKLNLHQQFGRAGRGSHAMGSLAIFVAGAVPLDQYYLKHPEELLDKTNYEDLCVSSLIGIQLHKLILENHLQCSAFELPIDINEDAKWFCNGDINDQKKIELFKSSCQEKLGVDNFGYYRTGSKYLPWPPEKVAIRAIELPGYAVVDITNGRNIIIEEVEESRTSFTLYEGGIFLHQGLPYLVKEFNPDGRFAKVQRVTVDWVTQQRDFSDIDPYEIELVRCLNDSHMNRSSDIPAYFGKIESTIIVFGFFKVNKKNEIIEAVEVKNPPIRYKSKGFWLDIPKKVLDTISEKSLSHAGGIHAAQHAIMNILPLFISGGATTNPNARFSSYGGEAELLTECKAPEKEFAKRQTRRKRPGRLIFYDSKGGPDGSGFSAKAFEYIDEIMAAAYKRIKNCDCKWGCPQCVTPGFCKEMLLVMSKPAAYIILGSLIGRPLTELADEVPDGPEENLPNIEIETVEPASNVVRMAKTVEVLAVKPALPLTSVKQEPESGL